MEMSTGTVYLVGAGPGDPDLITVKGLELLRRAGVVVYDRLIPRELLLQCHRGAELIHVGKKPGRPSIAQEQINRMLIDGALQGKLVVRLKGGDPFVFGRGGEEQNACQKAGVHCVVVPGVSSALAAPAAVGIPVTYRQKSRHFVVVTGHSNGEGDPLDYSRSGLDRYHCHSDGPFKIGRILRVSHDSREGSRHTCCLRGMGNNPKAKAEHRISAVNCGLG